MMNLLIGVAGGIAAGIIGGTTLTNSASTTVDTNVIEELTYLRNYTRLDNALDNIAKEDEDYEILYHDLVRIDGNNWLWTYSIYDTYYEETQSVRMAFNNDITECIWADYVEDGEYVKCDPDTEVDMGLLWEYMER